jgi:hypothetical protein
MSNHKSVFTKQMILATCNDFMTSGEIAEFVGVHHKTVCLYLRELGDCIIKVTDTRPWKYKRNPEKQFVPSQMTRSDVLRLREEARVPETYPILPQGPLSFLKECERYKLPKLTEDQKVKEGHGSWIHRQAETTIGSGSCAHLELAL